MSRLFQAFELFEQFFRFLGRQNRRGFVKYQNLSTPVQRFEYFELLLISYGQIPYHGVSVQIETVRLAQFLRQFRDFAFVDEKTLRHIQNEILADRQRIDEHKVLVHHTDIHFDGVHRRRKLHFLSVDEHLSGIGLFHSVNYLHQR